MRFVSRINNSLIILMLNVRWECEVLRATCDCVLFSTCFDALDFRETAYERLITRIRGSPSSKSDSYIVREQRIIARGRARARRVPELFEFNGMHGERFSTVYRGWRYLSKSTRLVATVCIPAIPFPSSSGAARKINAR